MTEQTETHAAAEAENVITVENQNPETAGLAEGTETPQQAEEQSEKQQKGNPWYYKRIQEEAEKRRRAEAELAALKAQQSANQSPENSAQKSPAPMDMRAAVEAEVRSRELQAKAAASYEVGKQQFKDYDNAIQTLTALGDGVSNPDFLETVFDLENPAAVLHALGSDPDKASEILQMRPSQMGRALEKISANLNSAPKNTPVRSPAPVISPVGKTSGATKRQEDWGPADWDKYYKEKRR